MKILVDTNVFLEVLLLQERAVEARQALELSNVHEFHISVYSLHTIATRLVRLGRIRVFREFLDDLILGERVNVLTIQSADFHTILDFALEHGLDFDDAYQYTLVEAHELTLLSFDGDFDRTPKGRLSPNQLISISVAVDTDPRG